MKKKKDRCKHRNNRWCKLDDSPCYDYINGQEEGENCTDYEGVGVEYIYINPPRIKEPKKKREYEIRRR